MKKRILSTVPIKSFPKVCKILESAAEVKYLEYPKYEEVEKIIGDFDGILPNARMKIDKNLLQRASKLNTISMPAMGIDHIDVDECKAQNIKLFSMGDVKDFMKEISSTAEYTIGLILLMMKKYLDSSKSVLTTGEWKAVDFRGYDIKDKIVGLIGCGLVGSQVEKILLGFGAKVIKYDPYVMSKDSDTFVDLDTLLRQSNIISCHIPLTSETKNMIDENCFSKMNDVYFVNASRGEVIEDESLIRALKRGNVRYAALDVLSGETVNDINSHILVNYARENKNLIITPHCAGSSNDGLEKVFEHAARTLVKNIGE